MKVRVFRLYKNGIWVGDDETLDQAMERGQKIEKKCALTWKEGDESYFALAKGDAMYRNEYEIKEEAIRV